MLIVLNWLKHNNLFKSGMDKFWMIEEVQYNHTAELTGTGDRSEYDIEGQCRRLMKVASTKRQIKSLRPSTLLTDWLVGWLMDIKHHNNAPFQNTEKHPHSKLQFDVRYIT